jgi:serine phosphatase RsbU (regulator of sigma subunit)
MFIAVVDCTGHGVPGAFMSMIGIRMLDEIVNDRKIYSPSQILETLNDLLRNALKQEQTDNNDGMDLSICRLEKLGNGKVEMTYSGAKRPIYIGRNSKLDIEVLEPDRKSIGGYQPAKRFIEFTNHVSTLEKGDMIYLFSDGLVDQNDPYRKKFGRARLECIIKSFISEIPEQQKTILESKIDEFIKDEAQRDDITLIGVKID